MGGLVSFFRNSFGKKPCRIIILGLEAAGKSCIVHRLISPPGPLPSRLPTPTIGFELTKFKLGKSRLYLWDLGGQRSGRGIWRHYFLGTQALVFVVDVSDSSRFDEAAYELARVVFDAQMQGVPLLVLGNKRDKPEAAAMTEAAVGEALGLSRFTRTPHRVQLCCALTGEGIREGFEWLVEHQRPL
eukprot:gnl/Trimastix_PCT/2791.p2 GENE.gnl/Trimastix_PCT/2791~~gnl/Trimastix_PCT/2791.p2  ORF type:complete len:186 (-),score=18.16 gnl/Trimastix_PCT/2791:153-710(-)